jgi:hypothetical protein
LLVRCYQRTTVVKVNQFCRDLQAEQKKAHNRE